MFAIDCPVTGRPELLSPRRILHLWPLGDRRGVLVRFRCWCGATGEQVFSDDPEPSAAAPAAWPRAPQPAWG